jgi:DNA-binding NtrC family response regulator
MRSPVRVAGSVLLVEDDDVLRKLLGRHMRALGCSVHEAANLHEVQDAFARNSSYDVVVTDIHLPDGDSVELIQRHHRRMPDMQVIFITGDHDDENTGSVLAADPAGLLLKPFDLVELDSMIIHALRTATQPTPITEFPSHRTIISSRSVGVLLRKEYPHHGRAASIRAAARVGIAVAASTALAFVIGSLLVTEDKPVPQQPVRATQNQVVVLPVAVPTRMAPPSK